MKVSQVTKTNFTAGSIYLKNIDSNEIKSLNAIRKIAEDKNIDFFISKREDSFYLPTHNMYLLFANRLGGLHTAACELVDKKTGLSKLSVRLYNSAVNMMEKIENNLKK